MSKPAAFNLFGEIVADDSQKWFDSDVVPAMVVGWLAKQDGDVEININSPGGDVAAGLAIANAIKGYSKGRVTANVMGIAASMASVVACACDEIKMGKGAFMMIHNPWCMAVGDSADLRHEADVMDSMRESLLGFYMSKTSKTHDELVALMDAETWIRADEGAQYGFAWNELEDGFKAAACAAHRDFGKAPEAARAFFAVRERPAPAASAPAAGSAAHPQSGADWEARYKGLMAKYNADAAAHRAELERMSGEYKASLAEIKAKHESEIADLNGRVQALNGDLEKAKADLSGAVKRAETAEQDLAAKSEHLARLEKAHTLLTGGVLSPGSGEAAEAEYQNALDTAGSAEQREEIRKAHRARAKTK